MNDQSLPLRPEVRVGLRQELFEIDHKLDVTLEVVCDRLTYFPGSRSTPEEKAGYVVTAIYLGGVDITQSVTDSDREDIERKVNCE